MRQPIPACAVALCLLSLVHAQQSGNGGSRPAVEAGHPSGSIQLDGKLDEPAWRSARTVELAQQSPKPGMPAAYRTTVRVLVLDNKLYFGFECTDPNPKAIAVHTMQRDGVVDGDDTVAVVLDTYGDHRTGYFFRVNAAGARVDGLVADSEMPSLDWDGIWDARTARVAGGWSAELVIPSNTLGFGKGLAKWGVNFERNIPRDRTVMRWSSPTLDSVLYDLSRAGSLTGVAGLEQGRGIEVSPFAVGKVQADFRQPNRVWQGQPGVDITWRITPQLQSVFTFNTDFAETEVDSRQLNVTRFGNTTWFGSFYDGRLLQQENYLRFTDRKGRWQVGLTSDQNFGRLKEGNFVQRLTQPNLVYAFSPNLVWTNFLQYDTGSQNIGNNMRLRWTIKPGNDLFIVWNRGWQRLLLSPRDLNIVPDKDVLVVKLRWTFRR